MYYQNKHLNLETEYNKWQSWDEWDYPVYDLFRFNLIVLQNKKHFSNKNILDLGSNLGYFSLFSLYSGCKNVKGIDVRSSKLEISKFICKKAGYTNFSFEEKNIKFKVKRNLNFESSPYGLLKKGLTYMLALKASHASLISVLLSA